ncbi:hypothetical protein DACRYDRAFT_15796 [Dacryopinax primogenitus]|uniref:Uncharacterized protein n=1 Tax=Dacryopinax primogenitus (strain DJM 731) TaxID=1858805 RepID=M5GCH5_DACPD|nr:uncharacterized protein DACRYDRAFT_15796 [Dacryopinax primogenitus]EJU01778.1 hypothetical protein DACRYDRAFT_15796 [Dacryopinax primogenitus]
MVEFYDSPVLIFLFYYYSAEAGSSSTSLPAKQQANHASVSTQTEESEPPREPDDDTSKDIDALHAVVCGAQTRLHQLSRELENRRSQAQESIQKRKGLLSQMEKERAAKGKGKKRALTPDAEEETYREYLKTKLKRYEDEKEKIREGIVKIQKENKVFDQALQEMLEKD